MKVTGILFACLPVLTAFGIRAEIPVDSVPEQLLDEIVVSAQAARTRLQKVNLGEERIELSTIKSMPAFFGEADIVKSLALMPGVHGEGDGGGGFEVRGGNSSQNLMLMDGITLFNPSHVMGIFSTFNDVAIGSATLYKGSVPAEFSGATSSVLQTTLAPGDMERWHAGVSVGILMAKADCSGPIVQDKLSMAVTARRSYADMFVQMVPEYRGTVMNFYDITCRLRYQPAQRDIVDVSFITGRDNMAIKKVMGMYWGNTGVSASWQRRCGSNVVITTAVAFTSSSPRMEMSLLDTDQEVKQYVRHGALTERIRWIVNDDHTLQFGYRSEFIDVKSGDMTSNAVRQYDIRSGWNNAVWADYSGSFGGKAEVTAGVRARLFTVPGSDRFQRYDAIGDRDKPLLRTRNYFNIEPRLSVKYNISELHNIKAGVCVLTQDLHSVRTSSTSFPFDRFALTSAEVKPEESVQYGIGYSGMNAGGDYDWSVEGYYKNLKNVYDYRDGCSMFSQVNIGAIILGGMGRSYGGEFMFRKNSGHLTGWVAYTLSHTQTRIPGINGGKWYNAVNDRRHDLSVVGIYTFNERWKVAATWIYSSGHPLTAPDVKYELGGTTVYYYSARNSYKTPPTHRMDLSATYTHRGRRLTYEWNFGFYNLYCRYNPYIIYFEDAPDKPSGTRAVKQAMFGLVPSLSYSLKF
ncbi:MAG: TonB-dependent receptor [Bacteroidales bacterium]|nr:TonB-dependent receptor [Bacteroidales bacterium]